MSVSYLSLADPMYDKIEGHVRETYEHSCIVWIEKISNPELEQQFEFYKATLEQPNVYTLFHGTSEDIARIIIRDGFDPSKNRTSAHGKGVYFSKRAAYSKDYAHPTSGRDYVFMLVCDVVTGKVGLGKSGTPIPLTFNSVTNSLSRPDMYIVDRREAALPKYLVAFYPKV